MADSQYIPNNANFTETVKACINALEEIQKEGKKVDFKKVDNIIIGLKNSLSSILNYIEKDFSKINSQNLQRFSKDLISSIDNIYLIAEKTAKFENIDKSIKQLTTIKQYSDILVDITSNMAVMVLQSPIYSAFIATAPIIYSALGVAMNMISKLDKISQNSIKMWINMKLFSIVSVAIIKGFHTIKNIISEVSKFKINLSAVYIKLLKMNLCVTIIGNIISELNGIHLWFLNRKLKKINSIILKINNIFEIINKSKNITLATKKILLYNIAIKSLSSLIISFIILAPLATIFILISPIIRSSMFLLAKTLNIIGLIINRSLKRKTIRGLKEISIICLGLTAVAISLIGLALITPKLIKSFPAILLYMLGLTAFVMILKITMQAIDVLISRGTKKDITELITTILILSGIASAMIVLALISTVALIGITNILLFMGGLIILIASIKLLTILTKSLLKARTAIGLLVVAGVIGSFIGIGYMLTILGVLAIQINTQWLEIMKFLGIVLLITVSMGLIGLALGFVLPIIPVMLLGLSIIPIMIGMLLFVAFMLSKLQELNIDNKLIKEKIQVIMSSIHTIMDAVFQPDNTEAEESDKGWFSSVLDFVFKPLGAIIQAILSVGFLAATLVSIGLILLIANQLEQLQTIALNESEISNNVKAVIRTAKMVSNSVNQKDDSKDVRVDKGFMGTLLNAFSPELSTIMDAVMSIGFLATSLMSICIIKKMAQTLLEINNIPVVDVQAKVTEIIGAAANVNKAIEEARVKEQKESKDSKVTKLLKWAFPALTDIVGAMMKVRFLASAMLSIGMIHTLATYLKSLNNIPNLNTVEAQTKKVIDASDKIMELINNEKFKDIDIDDLRDRIELIDDLKDIFEDFGDLSESKMKGSIKFSESLSNLMTKINTVDIDKLKTSENIFSNMVKFSESINGNFDKLADALSEKIAPLLEELRDLIGDLPTAVENSSNTISGTIQATAKYTTGHETPAEAATRAESEWQNNNPGQQYSQAQREQDEQRWAAQKAHDDKMKLTLEKIYNLLSGTTGQMVQVKVK